MAVSFNKTGYDPFIDFIKTYCILVVVFCHGFPYLKEIGYPLWGGQIPLFILIQVFHCYKRDPKAINWNMMLKRILLPFFVIEFLIFCILFFTGKYENIGRLISVGMSGGGYGPGSYYPWIFVQMAVIIPLMRSVCEKFDKGKLLFIFLLISEAIEIICSLLDMPDAVYRLLCLRYIMLIWFGWIWVKEGVKLNLATFLISLISLISIVCFGYIRGGFEPWFYETGWATHRWPCYFWFGILLVWILYKIYVVLCKYIVVKNAIKLLASASYEIFLAQMACYAIFQSNNVFFVSNIYIQFIVWFTLVCMISIMGGIFLYKFEKNYWLY